MQLMTFNSLLMFDIVFVFFLFLVGVTCLVYYLPTGGGGKHHNHSHGPHLHDHETGGEASNCRFERHKLYACPHHRPDELQQLRCTPQPGEGETEGTETETESESTSCLGRNREHNCDHEHTRCARERVLTPLHLCRCSLSSTCTVCAFSGNTPTDCIVTADDEGDNSSSAIDLRLLEQQPTPHHHFCHRHSIQTDRCLHFVGDEDAYNDSDDIFHWDEEATAAMNGFGGLFNSVSPIFEHVVVNETENGPSGTTRSPALTAQQCCFIKAKFMDTKECVGPVADV